MTDLSTPTRTVTYVDEPAGLPGKLAAWLRGPDDSTRPPYLMAGLVALGAFVLYVATLAPTTQFWDTSEYIAAAYVLGIPHPPGNPLFVLIAHAWGLLPLAASYAERINLLAAFTSALAAGFWFLVGERWLRAIVPAAWPRRLAALAGAVCSATAFTVWNQSVVNEKVYTLSLLSIALVLWLAVRWGDQTSEDRRDHHLLVIVYLLGLTATNHLMGLLVAPAVLVYVLYTDPKLLVSPRFLGAAVIVAAVGVSVWLFLPIRAGFYPPINEGEPTTWEALKAVLNREQYGKPPLTTRQATLPAQVGMWVQYFTWQWGRDWNEGVRRSLAVIFGSLGVLGAWRHWRADKRSALAMTSLVVTLTLVLIFYLNFKYGFSQYLDRPQLQREVRERDYFFIGSFALWGVWVGMGLATVMEWGRDFLEEREPDDAKRWMLATPVLLVALIPLFGNRLTASRAGETMARDFAYDLLQSAEPYGILVTAGDNDTFPLWYAQEVEGIRKDVTVLNLSLANTDWYVRQLQRRPVFEFDSIAAPSVYRGRSWPKPAGPILSYTADQLATLQPYYVLDKKTPVNLGKIVGQLDPEALGRQYLERADIIVLQAIKDNWGKRPIYYSRTVGLYADQFGLTNYLEGQGFGRKLWPAPVPVSDSIKPVQGLGYVNIPRTTKLLFEVYHGDTAARPRPRGWVDRPSEGIPALYGLTYQAMAQVLQAKNPELGSKALVLAESIFKNTSYGFTPPPER
jgi:transmembrane protein TMEM260 (protein O-mannosyltransferase)